MKIKKISIFLISGVLLFYFNFAFGCQNNSDCGDPSGLSVRCVNGKCIRPLEIAYPKIGSEQLTEEVIVKEGLPGYVKFIFNLAIGIVGLIILGNLVFSGVGYITSVGDPGKMNEAKSGILSSILGALILFSSVMVFRQINPKLVELKLEPVDLLLPPVQPGIYICEYKVDTNELETAINNYLNLNSNQETRLAAIKSLQKIIWDKEKKRGCYRVNYSGNLKFNVTSNGNTIFQIPYFSIDPNTYQSVLKWEYGIILHEKENFGGKCKIFPQEENGLIYHQINNFSATGMDFT
ncbi:MAG: pilin, partial [candidate division WOR-3 bacterium]